MTAAPQGLLAQAAERTYLVAAPDFPDPTPHGTPGVRSYPLDQLALLLLAVAIGGPGGISAMPRPPRGAALPGRGGSGARVALALGAWFPALVSRVIALDPPVNGPGWARYPYSSDLFLSWRAAIEARGVTAALESNPAYTAEEARLRTHYGLSHSMHALTETWFGFHLEDVYALARDLQVPALLLYGERGVVGDEDAAELAAASPLLSARRVPGAGHNVPWDAWPAVTAAIEEFFGRPEPAPTPM